MANEIEQERLQRLLEGRIKRHGIMHSYRRGCRCERCKGALSELNKRQYALHGTDRKLKGAIRQKFKTLSAAWVEEYFPEVAEELKQQAMESADAAE
jgi:hypothetical protein